MSYGCDWDFTGVLVEATVDHDRLIITTTDGTWSYVPEGDCCAAAYIHEPKEAQEDLNLLVGQKIKANESSQALNKGISGKIYDFSDAEDWGSSGDVRDIHFYNVQGEKGYATITLYVDHNGYYGGSLRGGKQ